MAAAAVAEQLQRWGDGMIRLREPREIRETDAGGRLRLHVYRDVRR